MYGRACRNLSLWRKYKTNIDTLLLIFAFFNEEGGSDIQCRSRSRRTPVNDERYANMGFANEYEVKVFKDYKEYQGRSNARKTVQGEDSVARFKRLEETLSRRGVAVPSVDDDFDFS